jgi:hypothetical protein
MPLQKYSFELLLQSDSDLQSKCIEHLENKFGNRPSPIYPDSFSPYFKDFYLLHLESDENKWDLVRSIMSVPGVIEADPVEKILGIFNKTYDHDNLDQDTHWNHKMTFFPEAIEYAKEQGKLNNKSTNIKIIQLDTGFTHHPEIQGLNHNLGVSFVEGEDHTQALDLLDDKVLQQPGHGTSTAGVIIGRNTNHADDKNLGVFPYVNFVPFRIARSVVHFLNSHIGAAVKAAVDAGADIITMSMGGAPPRASWRRAANYAYSKGVIFIAAAGNEVKFVVWPARYKKVIAVAGVNNEGLPWEGSCRGTKVQISAPGENVFVPRVLEENKYYYSYGSGTSYATPHVAAAAALWLNHFKEELKNEAFELRPDLKVAAFRWALKHSANIPDLWDEKTRKKFGAGILNARDLLNFSPLDFLASDEAFTDRGEDDTEEDEIYTPEQKELFQILLQSEEKEMDALSNQISTQASPSSMGTFGTLANQVLDGSRGEGGENLSIQDFKAELLEQIENTKKPTMSSPKLYALLVGINKYQTESFKNLLACKNDVREMNKILEKKFKAENRDILTLVDEKANKEAIINGFEKHLTKAKEGDYVLFYYSGHGATERTPEEFKPYNPSHKIENIVCYDSRTEQTLEDGTTKIVFDLADKEIAYLLSKVDQNKPHITVIMDCCHSGSATRGEDVEEVLVKQGDMNKRTRPGNAFYGYENASDFTPPESNHILLSACRNDQKAQEAFMKTSRRGVFSYFLTKILDENPDINYIDLFNKAQSFLSQKQNFKQLPQFQTSGLVDPFYGFLSNKRNIGEQVLPLVKEDTGLYYINKGYLDLKHYDFSDAGHGLKIGIYEQDDEVSEENLIATATTTDITHNRTYIEFRGNQLRPNRNYKAAVLSFPASPFLIEVEGGNTELLELLEQTISEDTPMLIKFIQEAGEADYKIVANDEGLFLYKNENDLLIQGATGAKTAVVDHIIRQLEKVTNWHWILNFQNPQYLNSWLPNYRPSRRRSAGFRPDNIDFWLEIDGKEIRAEDELYIRKVDNEVVNISSVIINKTGEPIYAAHAYLGQPYDVHVKPKIRIDNEEEYAFYANAGLKMETEYWDEEYYHFKVVVSETPFPEVIMGQKRIKIGDVVHFDEEVGPYRSITETTSKLTWFAKTIKLKFEKA